MKTLPSKCPITPCPEAQALIEKHDLVYVGVGSDEKPLLPRLATGIGLYKNGKINFYLHDCWNGSASENYYFFSRAEVAKYYKPARVRKPKTIYFHSPSTKAWVGKISGSSETEYGFSGSVRTTSAEVINMVERGLVSGTYKTLTRAEFLTALKKFGVKEDGTKIAPKTDHKAENARLKASLAAAEAEIATLKAKLADSRKKLVDFAATF